MIERCATYKEAIELRRKLRDEGHKCSFIWKNWRGIDYRYWFGHEKLPEYDVCPTCGQKVKLVVK